MILSAKEITKDYVPKRILDNCSFEVSKSGCVGLIGPNGAGKSTLLKIILGLLPQTEGSITYFNGQELNNKVKRQIGFFMGVDYLPEEMTGKSFLRFIASIYHCNDHELESKILTLANYFFDDDSFINVSMRKYSLGMKQKLGICSSLIMTPKLLILDEPFIGLDSFSAANLIRFLNKYKQTNSIIVSSHDLYYMEEICDKILLLEKGKLTYNGEVHEFTDTHNRSIENAMSEKLARKPKEIEPLNWLI